MSAERDPLSFVMISWIQVTLSWSLLKGFPLTIFVTTEGHILLLLENSKLLVKQWASCQSLLGRNDQMWSGGT